MKPGSEKLKMPQKPNTGSITMRQSKPSSQPCFSLYAFVLTVFSSDLWGSLIKKKKAGAAALCNLSLTDSPMCQ